MLSLQSPYLGLLPHEHIDYHGMAFAVLRRCARIVNRGAPRRNLSFTYPSPRKLDDIVKLHIMAMEEPDKIVKVWTEFHDRKLGVASGVLRGRRKFEVLMQRARKSPFFVYPLKSETPGNFSVLMAQFQGKHCLMTGLEDYVEKKEEASPHLVVTFYDELLSEKDLVLVRTDICNPGFSKESAEKMNSAIIKNYLTSSGYEIVDKFNHAPKEFEKLNYLPNPDNHL
ncbi:hypothetical protein AAMO2058_000268700 [Amorphochlora amoebiformis]